MEFKVRSKGGILCELTVRSGNATITEDMASSNLLVPKSEIEELIMAAVELNRFNRDSDVDFITNIIDNWSDYSDREKIAEYIQKINQK